MSDATTTSYVIAAVAVVISASIGIAVGLFQAS